MTTLLTSSDRVLGEIEMPFDAHASKETTDPFDTYRTWFSRTDTLVAIDLAAQETVEWLVENKHSIDADGRHIVEPWFDNDAFSAPLLNEMSEWERHHTLEIKAHEHGIGYFLLRLDKHNVLDCIYQKSLVFLRSAELYSWMRYLVRMSWKNESINLKQFRDSGDFGCNTPQAHAKSKLLRAAELGVALVDRSVKPNSYAISAGPIGKIFYESVWYTVVKDRRNNIKKWS